MKIRLSYVVHAQMDKTTFSFIMSKHSNNKYMCVCHPNVIKMAPFDEDCSSIQLISIDFNVGQMH